MDALVKAYEAGTSIRKLAAQLGVSHTAIHRKLKGRVVMRPIGGRAGGNLIPQEVRDKVADAYARDVPMADIMAEFDVCDETVRRIADEAGIPRRPVGGRQRLDPAQIAELSRQEWPPDAIAVLVGASPSRVRTILRDLAEDFAEMSEADANTPGE
ncbi:helix-turn-helix domain-containing protein [Nonomuraea basaltis]|uniref:helix-turn-helix domain-containing protein n=1 Tax=Nonomuraea basaltis TaxID=2495887 RepID=UPI00110C4318|nr:hypothetical protein [Nonomuraea basaltis]TMR97304.1 hypothetical protein EJK15_18700 [Nonomuraea basaltis]